MLKPGRYTSIIFTHHADNEFRAELGMRSLNSLIQSTKHLPVEIIVVDNGGFTKVESDFFNDLVSTGLIECLVRNRANMHFGFARNQALSMAKGDYICIVDNDLVYQKGWLDECLLVLERFPHHKIYATPLDYPTPVMKEKYDQGWLQDEASDTTYQLNMRAGSNCFLVRKNDFDIIGGFKAHRIAGSIWTDHAVRAGYLAAIIPGNYVKDEGLRRGYNLGVAIPIKRVLANGEEVFFNQDEL